MSCLKGKKDSIQNAYTSGLRASHNGAQNSSKLGKAKKSAGKSNVAYIHSTANNGVRKMVHSRS